MDHLTDKQRDVLVKLKERYKTVHPVLFERILERAKNEVELFDILDTLPTTLPLVWDMEKRRFLPVTDILKR